MQVKPSLWFTSISFLVSFLIPSGGIWGQSPVFLKRVDPEKPIYFNHLTRRTGLPSINISCVVQDTEGFIWIATDNGLVRYDGSSFLLLQHDSRDPNSITDNSISTIRIGPDSMLWIGTINGLSVFNPVTLRSENFPMSSGHYGSQDVRSFFFDREGFIWIGTLDGLFRMDPHTGYMEHYLDWDSEFKNTRESRLNEITYILEDPRNKEHLLLGTNGGLILFDKRKGILLRDYEHVIRSPLGLNFGTFSYVLDEQMRLWTHGWITGLNMFDLKTEKWTDYVFDSEDNAISNILWGEKNEIIMTSLDEGIVKLDLEKLEYSCFPSDPSNDRSLISNIATFLMRDRDQNLWVVCEGGVCIEDKFYKSFEKRTVPFPYGWISSFYHDPVNRRLYIGAYDCDGLFCKDEVTGTWHIIRPDIEIPGGEFRINTLFCDSKGVLWVGTRTSLFSYGRQAGQLVLFRTPDGKPLVLQDKVIYALNEDSRGNLWIGTRFDGVVRLDPSREHAEYFKHLKGDSTSLLEGSHIRGIQEDMQGEIWIGSTKGFCIYNPATGTFSSRVMKEAEANGIDQRAVYSIEMDTNGRMWLSCNRQGMLRVSPAREDGKREFTLFTTRDGLYDAKLLYFSEDMDGNFWIVNNGLVCMNPYTGTFNIVSVYNGLHEPVTGDVKTYVDIHGNLYVGDETGYETINRRDLMNKNSFFNLVLGGIDLNGRPYSGFTRRNSDAKFVFAANERNLTFRYTAVTFNPFHRAIYQYYLEGYDREWSRPDRSGEARYTNLPPGSYTFRVRATSQGISQSMEQLIRFRIRPYFWTTWWFISACTLLFACFVWIIYSYRRNQRVRMENLRAGIASDLHDDVSSTLSSISILSSLAAKRISEPRTSELIVEIGNNAKGMLEHTDDIIWAVNPRNDRFQDLGLRVREYAIPLFESKNIRFRIEFPESLHSVKIPMDVRKNLYLIAKEAVNNLVKYSACTEAEVIVTHEHSWICLQIKDNGKGFDPVAASTRNGTRSMAKRAERINAKFRLDTGIGKGTRITVEFKII